MLNHEINRAFRARLAAGGAVLMPGAANALAARVIGDLGFEAIYLSGAGLTNTYLGMPDLGFVSLTEIAQHTATIRDACELPFVVDADTGFGNALNVRHTVRTLERAGASAIQLEDQVNPKRCGHFSGKDVVPLGEARSRIKAAVDARQDSNFLIVARTDARAIEGFDAAIARAQAYVDAGADVTFVEAVTTEAEIRALPSRLACPQFINIVYGGKTPPLAFAELDRLGYGFVLYANAALQAAIAATRHVLGGLHRDGSLDSVASALASFSDRQRIVRKDHFDALERRYASATDKE